MDTALDNIPQGFCLNLQTYAPKYAIFNSIIQIFAPKMVGYFFGTNFWQKLGTKMLRSTQPCRYILYKNDLIVIVISIIT